MANHEIGQHAPRPVEQIADGGGNDVLDRGFIDDFGERVGEILEDDDAFGARIAELVLEFAGGIHRVDIDNDETGTKGAAQDDRVLQHVGQHDCDALAAQEAERVLQITGEVPREFVELPIGDRLAHVGKRRPPRVLLKNAFEQIADRSVRRLGQDRGYARWIGLQPDFFHEPFPVIVSGSAYIVPVAASALLMTGQALSSSTGCAAAFG